MVSSSLSIILSLPTSSIHSNSTSDLYSTPTSLRPILTFKNNSKPVKISPFLRFSFQQSSKVLAFSSNNKDGSAGQFLENNSIADFMRFKRGSDRRSGELQTAVVGYRKWFPRSILYPFFQIDLVSTIHIADKEYFATLQNLEPYDCVLYEMVASRESSESRRNPAAKKRMKGSRSRGFNILGCIQRQMARILMLDFQLHCFDYQAENWYHADLDYETFKLLQA